MLHLPCPPTAFIDWVPTPPLPATLSYNDVLLVAFAITFCCPPTSTSVMREPTERGKVDEPAKCEWGVMRLRWRSMYVCMFVCMHVYICMYVCKYVWRHEEAFESILSFFFCFVFGLWWNGLGGNNKWQVEAVGQWVLSIRMCVCLFLCARISVQGFYWILDGYWFGRIKWCESRKANKR